MKDLWLTKRDRNVILRTIETVMHVWCSVMADDAKFRVEVDKRGGIKMWIDGDVIEPVETDTESAESESASPKH